MERHRRDQNSVVLRMELERLLRQVENLGYGAVSLRFVVHDGLVVRVLRGEEVNIQVGPSEVGCKNDASSKG